tara:strand:- start:1230 stop:2123 length:894 start_codon:yes stop_codon:yes gene_type:complete
MSTKISKKAFIEALRNMIRKEIEEVSTSAATPGYMTPNAFSGKGSMDRRNSIASGSGYDKVDESNTEKLDEVKFAVTIDMGKLGQGKVLVDAGSKGAAVTSVAQKLKQGRNGIISVSRVQPSFAKQTDKKIETITVDEAVDPKVKKQAAALLKRYTNNWKKLEKETEMMLKFAKKNKAREMAFNFEWVLKKLKGNVWDYISYQVKEPMDDYFYESINEGKYHQWRNDESLTPKQKIGHSIREVKNSLNELDKTVKMAVRLKTELNVDSRNYWKNTHKALTKISERLVKMATKVGNLK